MTTSTAPRTRRPAVDAPRADAYQVITDRIIGLLESGTAPWRKPWSASAGAGSLPTSMSTKRPYRGINLMLLAVESMVHGFSSTWWGTYKQIKARGGQVRGGEKGTQIVFWKTVTVEDNNGDQKTIPMMRLYTVFNADQADGDLNLPVPAPRSSVERIEACEAVMSDYFGRPGAPTLRHGGSGAVYFPGPDVVELPDAEEFDQIEEYYTAGFHEAAHSTGHTSRLDRPGISAHSHFGDALYSKEELVAELTAAYLAGHTGIATATENNSAAYLRSWVSVLRGDKKLVVQAAQQAQKAMDLILGETAAAAPEQPAELALNA